MLPGQLFAMHLAREKGGPVGIDALAALCRHFDPQRIMNPGKLIADGDEREQHEAVGEDGHPGLLDVAPE